MPKVLRNFYQPIGRPLSDGQVANPSFFACDPNIIIGLSCSGGGSRAAYLTAAILREIRRTNVRVTLPGVLSESDSLLGQISAISSVSGGSMAAAYYVLNSQALRAEASQAPWQTYLNTMALDHSPRKLLQYAALHPLVWPKFIFTNFNRGHLARQYYSQALYDHAVLSDLPEAPALYMNAVDVVAGRRFVFSKFGIRLASESETDAFDATDLANSSVDPRSVQVSDAVYASSAFPFVYPHMPIFDYLENPASIHFLADGGILDNSGLLTLMSQIEQAFRYTHNRCYVLAIYIDAERELRRSRLVTRCKRTAGNLFTTVPQDRDAAVAYGWKNTFLRHGLDAIDVMANRSQALAFDFLTSKGVIWLTATEGRFQRVILRSFDEYLKETPPTSLFSVLLAQDPASALTSVVESGELYRSPYWKTNKSGGGPLLAPGLIWLGLRWVVAGFRRLLDAGALDVRGLDEEFRRLLERAGFGSVPCKDGPERIEYEEELEVRLGDIKTDFKLAASDRVLLDLAAYILVHASLEPALSDYKRLAGDRRT